MVEEISLPVKSPREIEIMKEGGKIAGAVREKVLAAAEPGVTTLELDSLAEKLILEAGGRPSFKGFEGYPFATCININEGVVHGLPTKRKLRAGDVVTVDLGVFFRGLHTDNARTIQVGSQQPSSSTAQKFLAVGQRALDNAIRQCRVGKAVGDISHAIQTTIEEAGYNVVRELGGHGVGRELHEEPFIPEYGQPGTGPKLKEGMTLAIEVIYTQGSNKVEILNDGWTIVTADGSLAGLFEHTVAVTKSGPIVLTKL